MLLLRRPNEDLIQDVIDGQRSRAFTYSHVGATRALARPDGFHINHHHSIIGRGEASFQRAVEALSHWKMLDLGWIRPSPSPTTIHEGSHVCTLTRLMGVYMLNVARIVYVQQSNDASPHFAFAYGTLPEYTLSGEERFAVGLDRETDEVSYELFSFSRLTSAFAVLGLPFVRLTQKRFTRDSTNAMRAAVRKEE